jgi:phosphatidylglycerophosphatase GEP4
MPLNLPSLRLTLTSLFSNPNPLTPHIQSPTILSVTHPAITKLPKQLNPSNPPIRALIFDKDNTLTPPGSLHIPAAYLAHLSALRKHYFLLIISNTAGAFAGDKESERLAWEVEKKFDIPVLRQERGNLKPLCGPQALKWLKDKGVVKGPEEVLVVGDRLSTDVLMGNLMGSWTWWVTCAVEEEMGKGRPKVSPGLVCCVPSFCFLGGEGYVVFWGGSWRFGLTWRSCSFRSWRGCCIRIICKRGIRRRRRKVRSGEHWKHVRYRTGFLDEERGG